MLVTGIDEEAYQRIVYRYGIFKGRREMAEEAAINLLLMGILTPEQIAQAEGLPLERVLEFEKNVQEGLQICRHLKAVEIATNMLKKGYQIEEISKYTDLKSEEILELQKSIQAKP